MLHLESNYKQIDEGVTNITELISNNLINHGDYSFTRFMNLTTVTKIMDIVGKFEKTLKCLRVLANSNTYKIEIYDLDNMVLFIRFSLRVSDLKLNRKQPLFYLNTIKSDLSEYKDIYGKTVAISYDKKDLIFGLNISELYKLFNQSDYSLTDVSNNSKLKVFEAPYIFYNFNKFWCYNPTFEDFNVYGSDVEYIRTIEKLAFPDITKKQQETTRKKRKIQVVTK